MRSWWLWTQIFVQKYNKHLGGFKTLFLLIGIIALILSVADLSVIADQQRFRFFLVIDITQSMNVKDMFWKKHRTSRLDYSKEKLKEFLPTLPCSSDVSVGIFTGHRSFVLYKPVEVCEHYSEVIKSIDGIDWRMAWEAKSEVAKGLHSALKVSAELGENIRVVFFTDGHEAPPLHPRYPPKFKGVKGQVGGIIVGVGEDLPVPIPKYSVADNFVGYWSANEVLQIDTYSLGRSSDDKSLVGVEASNISERVAQGKEHLSSLKEDYLKKLSEKVGLDYIRSDSGNGLKHVLASEKYAIIYEGKVNIAKYLALLALLCFSIFFLWPNNATKSF